MTLIDFTDDQIHSMDDEMLVLAEASISRLPLYDTDDGKVALIRYQTEIARRNLDVAAILRSAIPLLTGSA